LGSATAIRFLTVGDAARKKEVEKALFVVFESLCFEASSITVCGVPNSIPVALRRYAGSAKGSRKAASDAI
jgi:hypothetical protein